MKKEITLGFTAVLFIFSGMTGCANSGNPFSPSGGELHRVVGDPVLETMNVTRGDTFDLRLQTIGPGEYSTPLISSPAVRFEGVSEGYPAVPAGPTQIFKFKAVSVGIADITIPRIDSPMDSTPFWIRIDVQ